MTKVIIDVREPEEYKEDHVEGSLNIPPASLMNGAPELNGVSKDAEIIVYCRTGSRSNTAIQFLKQLGYTNLKNGINKDQVLARFL